MDVESSPVERAQRRFVGALDALEAAVRRRQEKDRSATALEKEIRTLSDDRSRLAQDLDKAQARSVQLESVSKKVSERLDSAIGSIRGLLDREQAG
jgi:predicted  nucleic acid-binding Zn-ribbon protein